MFLVYSSGQRVSTAYEGRAAEFCPVCLGVRACSAYSIFTNRHVYLIPITRREYLALELRCETCGAGMEQPWNAATRIVRNRRATLDSLVAAAPAAVRAQWNAQESMLKAARSLPGGSTERLTLLAEALYAIERKGQRRHRGMHFDGLTTLMTLACVGGTIGGAAAMRGPTAAAIRMQDQYMGYLGAYALSTVVLTLIAAMTDRPRYFRRALEPMIVRVVALLGVSAAELAAVRSEMAPLKLNVVRSLRPARIAAAAERLQRRGVAT